MRGRREGMVESYKICYFGIMCYVICYLFQVSFHDDDDIKVVMAR